MLEDLSQPFVQEQECVQENAPIQQLLGTFERLYKIKDSIHQEYELIQAAQQSSLPLESFRELFKVYCQQQNHARLLKCWWKMPFFRLEQGLEKLNQTFSKWDLFQALEYASKLSVLIGVLVFLAEAPQRAERQKAEQKKANYEAWQIISANEGRQASGGRIDALQDLNENKVSLARLNAREADLAGVNLSKANLREAVLISTNFSDGDLSDADLRAADLAFANLEGANLRGANLRGANLSSAKFKGANLSGANLTETRGLSPAEVKKAEHWQFATYSPEFRQELDMVP